MRVTLFTLALAACVGCGGKDSPTVPKASFTPSKETTYITEPLDKDGYLDYETALNEKLRGKITPETNAVVLMWQALGPKPEGTEMHADYWKWLQVEPPVDGKNTFVSSDMFFRGKGLETTGEDYVQKDGQFNRNPWKSEDDANWAEWLKANETALELVTRASQRPEYYFPLISRNKNGDRGLLIDAPLAGVQKMRLVTAALAKRAMLRTGEGKFDDAWKDLMTLHRLARLFARGSLLEMLVGYATDGIAVQADIAFLNWVNPKADQSRRYAADLRSLEPMSPLADKVALGERFNMLDIVQFTHKHGFASLSGLGKDKPPEAPDAATRLLLQQIDWDVVFGAVNPTYDRVTKIWRQTDRVTRLRDWNEFEDELRDQRKQIENHQDLQQMIRDGGPIDKAVSEKVGKILVTLMFPALNKVEDVSDRLKQNHINLQLAFALAAYRADHGKYPAKLAELAPKYLAAVPDDLFSGKPLIYKPADGGYVLYSVGVNGSDDDGMTFGEGPFGDDLTVRMK